MGSPAQKKTEEWQRLAALGGDRVTPKQMDKMIEEWIKRARKTITKNEKRALDELIKQGAKKANIADYRARALLLQAMGIDTDSSAVFLGFSPKTILLLEKSKNFLRVSRRGNSRRIINPSSPYGDRAGSAVPKAIIAHLERNMSQSLYVDSISTKPQPDIEPEGLLTFGMGDFNISFKDFADGTSKSAIYMEAQIQLTHLNTGLVVLNETIVFNDDYAKVYYKNSIRQYGLEHFYDRVTLQLRETIERFLAQ